MGVSLLSTHVLNKEIDEDGPSLHFVVLGKISLDGCGKVKQEVPGVLGNGLVVLSDQKRTPLIEERKSLLVEHKLPQCNSRVLSCTKMTKVRKKKQTKCCIFHAPRPRCDGSRAKSKVYR